MKVFSLKSVFLITVLSLALSGLALGQGTGPEPTKEFVDKNGRKCTVEGILSNVNSAYKNIPKKDAAGLEEFEYNNKIYWIKCEQPKAVGGTLGGALGGTPTAPPKGSGADSAQEYPMKEGLEELQSELKEFKKCEPVKITPVEFDKDVPPFKKGKYLRIICGNQAAYIPLASSANQSLIDALNVYFSGEDDKIPEDLLKVLNNSVAIGSSFRKVNKVALVYPETVKPEEYGKSFDLPKPKPREESGYLQYLRAQLENETNDEKRKELEEEIKKQVEEEKDLGLAPEEERGPNVFVRTWQAVLGFFVYIFGDPIVIELEEILEIADKAEIINAKTILINIESQRGNVAAVQEGLLVISEAAMDIEGIISVADIDQQRELRKIAKRAGDIAQAAEAGNVAATQKASGKLTNDVDRALERQIVAYESDPVAVSWLSGAEINPADQIITTFEIILSFTSFENLQEKLAKVWVINTNPDRDAVADIAATGRVDGSAFGGRVGGVSLDKRRAQFIEASIAPQQRANFDRGGEIILTISGEGAAFVDTDNLSEAVEISMCKPATAGYSFFATKELNVKCSKIENLKEKQAGFFRRFKEEIEAAEDLDVLCEDRYDGRFPVCYCKEGDPIIEGSYGKEEVLDEDRCTLSIEINCRVTVPNCR